MEENKIYIFVNSTIINLRSQ